MAPISDADNNNSSIDFYDLLSISPSSTESEIRRAYRKTSLLYHPDKVTPTPETLEKFALLQKAIEVLTDSDERKKYDALREAKLRRKAEHEVLDEKRRKMKEDLERREKDFEKAGGGGGGLQGRMNGTSGVKRSWTERELEIQRIAEENRKKMEEVVLRRREEARKVVEKKAATDAEQKEGKEEGGDVEQDAGSQGDALQRSVKVRWIKEDEGLEIDEDALREMFAAGELEDVVVLKDKKRKLDGRNRKVVMGTAVLVFKSKGTAKRVVAKGRTDELESVAWAVEKESEPS